MRKSEPVNLLGETIGQAFDRACKERDALKKALKEMLKTFDRNPHDGAEFEDGEVPSIDLARSAIAKATTEDANA